MRNPLVRWLISLAISAATFSCLYAWKVHGIDPAGNLFLFWMWFVAAMGCVLLFTPRKYMSKTTYPKNSFLAALSWIEGLILIALLVWFGSFVLAVFFVIGLFGRIAYASAYDCDGKLKDVGHA